MYMLRNIWIIAKCIHFAKNLQNLHIWKLRLPNVDNYPHMAKFCHFLKKSNGILLIVHNRQNETRIKENQYILFKLKSVFICIYCSNQNGYFTDTLLYFTDTLTLKYCYKNDQDGNESYILTASLCRSIWKLCNLFYRHTSHTLGLLCTWLQRFSKLFRRQEPYLG